MKKRVRISLLGNPWGFLHPDTGHQRLLSRQREREGKENQTLHSRLWSYLQKRCGEICVWWIYIQLSTERKEVKEKSTLSRPCGHYQYRSDSGKLHRTNSMVSLIDKWRKKEKGDVCYKDWRVITTNHHKCILFESRWKRTSKRKQMTSARQLEIEHWVDI